MSLTSCSACERMLDVDNAKLLPCLHGICHSCLSQTFSNSYQIQCQKCSQWSSRSDVIDNFLVGNSPNEQTRHCQVCQTKSADIYGAAEFACQNCSDMPMCDICVEYHRKWWQLNRQPAHRIIKLPPSPSPQQWNFACSQHRLPLSFCCSTCRKVTCSQCLQDANCQHTNVPIQLSTAATAEKLQRVLQTNKQWLNTVTNECTVANRRLTEVSALEVQVAQQIRMLINDIGMILINRGKILMSQLSEVATNKRICYESKKTKLMALSSALHQVNSVAETALQSNNGALLLLSQQAIERRMSQTFPDEPVDLAVPVNFGFRAQPDVLLDLINRFGEIFGSNHDSLSLGSDSITLPGPSANSTTTAASVRPHYARKSFPPSLPIGPIMGRNHLLSEIVGSTNSCPSTPTEKKRCIESLDTVTPAVLPTIPSTVRPTIIHKAKDDELPPAAISNIDVSPLESAIAKTATEFSPRAAEALPTQSVIINKVGETQNGIETAKFANCESESDIQFQSIKKSTIASTIAEATAAKSILKVASPSSPLINVVDVSPEGSQAIASQGNLPLVSCAVCRWQNVDGRMSTMECSKCRKIFHSACHPTPLDKQSDFVCAICLDYKSLMNDYDEIYEGEIRAPSIITPYEYQICARIFLEVLLNGDLKWNRTVKDQLDRIRAKFVPYPTEKIMADKCFFSIQAFLAEMNQLFTCFTGSNLPKETESVLKVYKEAVRCLIPAYSEKVVDLMPDLRTNNQSENEEPSRKRVKMMNDLNFPGPNEQLNNNNPVIEAAQTA